MEIKNNTKEEYLCEIFINKEVGKSDERAVPGVRSGEVR